MRGYVPGPQAGSIGVFAGVANSVYLTEHVMSQPEVYESVGRLSAYLANGMDYAATRLSYKLDLRGPSVSIGTACSTSLVALHLAAQSLRSGESDIALAGGACIGATAKVGYPYIDGGVLSRDGRVYTFDHRASGQSCGNGAALVVLKRLEDALADGDTIRSVVKGSAMNNDGSQKFSFSAPTIEGQVAVVAEALDAAGVHPEAISYVEAHGTGTRVGDPIEVAALTRAFRAHTQKRGYCPIGSVKTNIGHMDAAAGAVSLIKTTLCLEHRQIPASLNFEKPNPEIDFESSPFFVNTELRAWETDALPRRACISSFGMGGTNAHVILEEAPDGQPASEAALPYQLLCYSARGEAALEQAQARLADHIEGKPAQDLADIAFTTHVGRKPFARRRFVVCRDREEACRALRAPQRQGQTRAAPGGRSGRVAFFFRGEAATPVRMGRDLYERVEGFRAEIDRCCELAGTRGAKDLRELVYAAERTPDEQVWPGSAAELAFTTQYALARVFMGWGVQPVAVAGDSVGECVAACVAGVLTLDEALQLVRAHANSKSGARSAELTEVTRSLRLHDPGLRLASSSSGNWVADIGDWDPGAWTEGAPRVANAPGRLDALFTEDGLLVVEIGCGAPSQPLSQLRAVDDSASATGDEVAALLNTLGELWVNGVEPDWKAFHSTERRRRVPLPTYPFQRQRFWIERGQPSAGRELDNERKPDPADWFYVASWRRSVFPPPARPVAEASAGSPSSAWLVLADGKELGAALVDRLGERGMSATVVYPGDGFERVDDGTYRIDPRNPADYVDMLETARERGLQFHRIVHLWGLDPLERASRASLDSAQDKGFFSLLFLVQALERGRAAIEVDVVTSGMQEVLGGDLVDPEKATVLGCCKAIQAEIAGMSCRSIDIDATESGSAERRRALDQLEAELLSASTDPVVAHRGNQRWLPTVEPTPLVSAGAAGVCDGQAGRLRERGVYLITGGFGGIGMAIAEDLARRLRARLVLLARSALPPRETWDEWLREHPEAQATRQKILQVLHLEELGAEVECVAADVSQLDAMGEAVGQIHERFGPLNGVVHCAGLSGGGLIEFESRRGARKVFASKIRGTQVLYEVLKDESLDFVVLSSSIASAVTGAGQGDYFAANAYLDAFARHARGANLPWTVSVGWEVWKETGMAADNAIRANSSKERDEIVAAGLTSAEGCEVLRRVLASSLSQVYVSTRDLPRRIEELERRAREGTRRLPQREPEDTRAPDTAPTEASVPVADGHVGPPSNPPA